MLRLAVILFVVLVAAAGGVWFFTGGSASAPEELAVRTEMVEVGSLTESVTAPGEIQSRTKVSISARAAAQIVDLPFKEGEEVRRGGDGVEASVLVRLDDTDFRARLRAAEANHAARQANLRVAEAQLVAGRARLDVSRVLLREADNELRRQQSLYASADVSRRALEEAEVRVEQLHAQAAADELAIDAEEANLDVLRYQIEAAEADIEQAREALTNSVIVSPIDGVVTRLNAEVGEIVVTGTMNNPGTVIMEVADLSQMIVRARVDETIVARVEVGQSARVRASAYGDRELTGVVRSVSLSNEQTRASAMGGGGDDGGKIYACEILLDPAETSQIRVFSGLTADVDIETRRHDDVMLVPTQAVVARRVEELPGTLRDLPQVRRNRDFTPVVFVVRDGTAAAVPVEVGAGDLQRTLIVSGLEPGQQVVTGPYKVLESLADGQPVQPQTSAP